MEMETLVRMLFKYNGHLNKHLVVGAQTSVLHRLVTSFFVPSFLIMVTTCREYACVSGFVHSKSSYFFFYKANIIYVKVENLVVMSHQHDVILILIHMIFF